MCGIAGIIKLDPRATAETERLVRMRDTLRHRGPDGEGILVDGPVGLSHRRLAIVDPQGGHQPMSSEAGDVWIVCNGEIYNHPLLKPSLEARGHLYRTRCDTETILHLYEEHAERCLPRLDGMFAFALWDRTRRQVVLARDRMGIKPLYYCVTRHEILFASEIKAILAAGGVAARLNEEALPEYLATRCVSGEETLFSGIRALSPASVLIWRLGEVPKPRPYWSLPDGSRPDGATRQERARAVRRALEQAAGSHLMSDVPIGLFLSGGLDSSALASLVAPLMEGRLRTFTVGFDDPASNEMAWARLVARAVAAEHHEVIVKPAAFFDALPRLVWHEDEPIAFSSSVPLYFVSRLAREHVKVVLTGEGADELFLGYNRYRVTFWNERLGRVFWRFVPEAWSGAFARYANRMPPAVHPYAARTFLTLPPEPRGLFFDNFAVIDERLQRRLLARPGMLLARDPFGTALRCWSESGGDTLERMSRADLKTYLVRLLMKQDRMSMAASLESRVPYLDRALVEQVAAMPGRHRMGGWRTKTLMRDALADLVPGPILRRRKMGFPVPVAQWLRADFSPILDEFVLSPRALERGLFVPAALRALVAQHRSGAANHGEKLWLLLNLEIWMRIFIDGETTAAPKGAKDDGRTIDHLFRA